MKNIYEEIKAKREAQHTKWGEQNYPSLCPLLENSEPQNRPAILDIPLEMDIKRMVQQEHEGNQQHWATIALEEFVEVITAETDYERREELLDLAAVIVQQIECLDRNNRCTPPTLEVEKFTDKTPMPFGKHKGIALCNVPAEYLLWLLDGTESALADGLLKDYIIENKEQLLKEIF